MAERNLLFQQVVDEKIVGRLDVDPKSGQLYWNEKLIVTEQKIELKLLERVAVVIASVSTLAIAVFTVLSYFCPL